MEYLILMKKVLLLNIELILKDIFGNIKNDPRLKGASAQRKDDITALKGVFTSCNDDTVVHLGLLL